MKILATFTTLFVLCIVVVSSVSATDLPHTTDFLTVNCCSHEFPSMSSTQRSSLINAEKSRGYKHLYIYAYNENDYGGPAFDYYTKPQDFKTILQQIVDAGLEPVVWLNPDDAPVNKNRSDDELKARMNNLIPVIDGLVSSYVLGLELNEYWGKSKVDVLGNHLRTLTRKKIAAHQTPGRWDYCKGAGWCDYMVLQYGFGKTASQIKSMTVSAVNDLAKPVVAGEYSSKGTPESTSISLGNAALEACAAGFGNGGTPSKIIWPGCISTSSPTPTSKNTPTPTSSINKSPVADNASVSTAVNTPVFVQLTFSDDDGPGPYTYTITQQPVNGALSGSGNDRTYTPKTGFSGTDSFKWKVNDGKLDSNIATVTITVTDSVITKLVVNDSANASNWSIRSNLQKGDLQYGDRSFTFSSVASTVSGSDWIRTANASRSYTGSTLATFTVTKNATVYIAHDDRILPKPSWLSSSNGWNDTGVDLVNNEPNTYSLYAKSYLSGSSVTLGPNTNSASMYTVVVKAGTPSTPTPTIASKPGDANGDGLVDGRDYLIWMNNYNLNKSGPSNGDFNNSGKVDEADYVIWLNNYSG